MENVVSVWSTISATAFTPWGIAASLSKFSIYITSFMAVGLLLFRLALPRAGYELFQALKPLVLSALILAALATMTRVLVQAGRLMDDGISGMFDHEIIAISLEGPLGQSTYMRLVGIGILLIAVFSPILKRFAIVIGAIMIAGSFALTGHATRDPQWLLGGLITFHLLAVSFWFGALMPLFYLAHPSKDTSHAAHVAERFGKQAAIIVPLLIAAGITFALYILGSPEKLFTTHYGVILTIKIGLVALILVIAAINKLRFVPNLAKSMPTSAVRFRLSLEIEGIVFLAIFAVTAVLTTSFSIPL